MILNQDQPKRKRSIKSHIVTFLDEFEEVITVLASRLGPWLAPIGPAYFVGRAVNIHLNANIYIAYVMALAVEFVGIASVHMALKCWAWNQRRRKIDLQAPFRLSVFLSSIYFIATLSLTVLVEVVDGSVVYAPTLFILLTGVAYSSLAISWRVTSWESERQQEKLERQREKDALVSTLKAARVEVEQLTTQIRTLTQQKGILEREIETLKKARRQTQNDQANGEKSPLNGVSIGRANEGQAAKIKARRAKLLSLQDTDLTQEEMAQSLGVNVSTVRRDLRALRVQKNSQNGANGTFDGEGA